MTALASCLAREALPRRADVVVVGGGIVGLSAAHYLTERGREVFVVDQGSVGGGTSHGNAGLVAPSHSIPLPAPGVVRNGLRWMLDPTSPFYVRPRLDRELAGWLARFVWASRGSRSRAGIPALRDLLRHSAALFDELRLRRELDFASGRDGVLNVYATPRSMEHGVAEARLLERYGLPSQVLDGDQLAALEPTLAPSLGGGVLWPEDGWVDPSEFVARLTASLAERGVRFAPAVELISLSLDRGRARTLLTTAGTVEAGEVVLAAGAWSPVLSRQLGLRLPVQPAKGYSVTSDVAGPVPRRPLLLVDAKVAVTPLAHRLRLAGTLELVGLDASISWRRVEAIRAAGERFLPGVELDPQARVWSGLRPLSADGLPVIGRPRALANVTIATGHGHIGVSLGPGTGQLVAEAVTGESPSLDLRPFSPDRF
jgi:D-amino-acid dehydrogenase